MKFIDLTFPEIEHISDIDIRDKPEIRLIKKDDYQVLSYMISDNDTFSNNLMLECRGITFDLDGNLVGRPLHKFFNLGEYKSKNDINWNNVIRVMDKQDGSMIHTFVIDDKTRLKSKKSYDSDVSVLANKFVENKDNYQLLFENCRIHNKTAIFEWTSPRSRIVLPYESDSLTLLHIRDNLTGEYEPPEMIETIGALYEIPIVENLLRSFNINELLEHVETAENIEGYVIQFVNGDMVKIKTPWYLNLHRTVTFVRERDIALLVIEESIDDYLSYLDEIGESKDKVFDIMHKVKTIILEIESYVESTYEMYKSLNRKDYAIQIKCDKYFQLLMSRYLGREVQYKDYFIKYILKDEFGLETI